MDDIRIETIEQYRRVDEMLATSGQPSEAQLAALAREGFGVVINLALHDDPRYSLPDEPALVHSLGMAYVHIPVAFAAPQESDLWTFFDAMDKHQGRKLLVHCAANMRVPAFLGLYRAIKQGVSDDEAFALMKSIWEPNTVWAAFIESMLQKHRM